MSKWYLFLFPTLILFNENAEIISDGEVTFLFLFIKLILFTPCICDLIQISQCLQQFCPTELPVMKEMFCAGATFGRYLKCGSWD